MDGDLSPVPRGLFALEDLSMRVWPRRMCRALWCDVEGLMPFSCTRPAGHRGSHVAGCQAVGHYASHLPPKPWPTAQE